MPRDRRAAGGGRAGGAQQQRGRQHPPLLLLLPAAQLGQRLGCVRVVEGDEEEWCGAGVRCCCPESVPGGAYAICLAPHTPSTLTKLVLHACLLLRVQVEAPARPPAAAAPRHCGAASTRSLAASRAHPTSPKPSFLSFGNSTLQFTLPSLPAVKFFQHVFPMTPSCRRCKHLRAAVCPPDPTPCPNTPVLSLFFTAPP